MVVETDGYTRPCCLEPRESARLSPISSGIKNAWTDKKLIFLREELKNGYSEKTRPWCSRCEKLEKAGSPSLRSSSPIPIDTELKGLQFKLSNRCQLACAHCGPQLSSTWAKISKSPIFIQEAVPKENHDLLINDLIDLLPTLSWIKFTGGEPWMDPLHWKILESVKSIDRSKCDLFYITNGLAKFDASLWEGWKSVNITVSVDGFEDTYNWFRRGANWDDLCIAVSELEKLNVKLDISYSITPWTIIDWKKSVNFWKYPVLPTPIVYPWYVSLSSLKPGILDVPDDYPYYNLIGTEPVETTKLSAWAKGWDKKWNTAGWAEKLHPWIYV